MKHKVLSILLSLSLLLALLPATALAAEGDVTVTIFTTNDIHGVVEHSDTAIGLAQAAAIKASTENALLVDAGDATQGASFATVTQGEDVVKVMNAAGYDAMAAGNHEFDYGTERLLANAEAAEFPILSANTALDGEPLLESSAVVEAGGKSIGFIGLTTTATATSTNPAQLTGVTFSDEVAAAKAQIAAMEDTVDAIVLICHLGDNSAAVKCTSEALLDALTEEELSSVAAVVDGHSHTVEQDAYVQDGISIPVVQTGTGFTALGQIELTFAQDGTCSAKGTVLDYEAAMAYPLTEAGTAASEKTAAVLEEIKAGQDELLGETLCTTEAPLWGGYIYYDYVESRIVETAYGDFVTDAFAASAKEFAENNGLDLPVVAVENGGGIGQTMPMGKVTRGDILNAFNHGNMVVALSVTPAQLYTALEVGLTMTAQDDTGLLVRERVSGSFLQASGFTYTYDPAGEAGAKVTAVALADGTQLSRDDTTTELLLATNNYTATFDGLKDGEQLGELGGEDLIVEDYLLAQTKDGTAPLDYPMTQGRIQIANDKSPEQYAVSIPVLSSADKTTPVAGATVHLKVDDGEYAEMTTDASGMLKAEGLAKGPHMFFLQEAEGQAVYVNNYSGSGTVTTKEGYYRLGFLVEVEVEEGALPFADVAADSADRAAVEFVYEQGLMTGTSDTAFSPAAEASRAVAVSALWKLAGSPEAAGCDFPDLETGAAYTGAVDWAASTGVVKGYADGSFYPNAPITREQLAVVLYRYQQSKGGNSTGAGSQLAYTDGASISPWAYEAVYWCAMNGILAVDSGALAPQSQVTRAELAGMLMRYAQLG